MKKQGFLLSSVILIIMVVITKILGLIYKIPLTNILGGEGFGYYSVAYSVFMPMFSISVSGITQAMSRLVSENAVFERYKNIRKIKRVSLIFFSLYGLGFTLLTVIIALPVCFYIVKEPSTLWSVIAISPCVFIGAIMSVLRGYYEGLRNMTPTAFTEILESVFKIVFG
ncbi:MAG: oligosaccharide flippase family protein, partial [Oscillospiraceae bacterium]|nr:oligosaccharide flippase family protein [Oscillospiraceae bacterium]